MMQENTILGAVLICNAIMMIALGLPLAKGRVSMNRWYGIRFRKAFESEENWYRINAHGGRLFCFWSIGSAISGGIMLILPMEPNFALSLFLVSMIGVILIPTLQSVRYVKKLD